MAAIRVLRRTLTRSSLSLKLVNGVFNSLSSSSPSQTPTFACLSRRKLPLGIARLPVELGCVQSLMPLHSVTASALLISKLSLKPGGWAWLSEGFATPL